MQSAAVVDFVRSSMSNDLNEFGEFAIISRLTSKFSKNRSVILGPGDDAAIVAMPDGDVVISTDMAVDGVHFRRNWSTPIDIGRRIAAQNLADIAAMGAYPVAMTVAIATAADTDMAWLEGLAVGIEMECAAAKCSVVGGDMSRGQQVVISITVLGQRRGLPAIKRSRAKAGDIVTVAGRLGYSAAGFACLQRGHRSPREAVEAFLVPQPPLAMGPKAAKAGARAMIDVSDGLVADLGHIAQASKVSIDLDRDLLPKPQFLVNLASAMGEEVLEWVLHGGEDHALVAIFPKNVSIPKGFERIGVVQRRAADSPSEPYVTLNGREITGKAGHDHFS